MTWDRIVVDLAGFGIIAFLAWFFWLGKRKVTRATVVSGGYQEQTVLVKGGYTPDVIVVEAGRPVRLKFVRQESASCSDTVVFPAFNRSVHLPEGETVPLELIPKEPGVYDFACPMGMFRGKLIAE